MKNSRMLHTLGPATTDCYRAALVYEKQRSDVTWQLQLHSKFAVVLQAANQRPGDYLLLPTALKLPDGTSWGDLHYRYLNRWRLVDVFTYPLDPLVLVQSSQQTNIVDLHPATLELAREQLGDEVQFRLASSKWAAYQAYRRDGEYCITNQANLLEHEQIVKRWNVDMVWTVYQVQEEN
ncbi:hypothetical protein M3M39_02010 [Fructilactobacillus hinvesii]|uniref:Uncharacterized protein n=1 Tax=Fructilactobacillus hinvesii TaxID=2940300 RepID=A0ABY5BV04_9LACO|nr:hypothetical protein [Fructilactobacillus hinvesii]USS88278.1 hypothetical protein M3M39_02010 [Fructilactobacillus hinvesii]